MENKPDNRKNGNQDPGGRKNRQPIFALLICLLLVLTFLSFFTNMLGGGSSGEITYDEFIKLVDDDKIEEVVLQDDTLTITLKESGSAVCLMETGPAVRLWSKMSRIW